MNGKIAIINHEFSELTDKLERTHTELIDSYKQLIDKTNQLVSSSGSFNTDEVSPKVQKLTESINSDVIARVRTTFQETENAIKNFETIILNIDSTY